MSYKQMPEDSGVRAEKSKKGLPILSVILSVVSAISLWFYVISIEDPTYTKTFEGIIVQMKNENVMNERGLEVIYGRGRAVNVTVRGRRRDINRYTEDDIKAFVDTRGVDIANTYNLAVQTEVPEGLVVIATDIKSIEIYADSKDVIDVKIDSVLDITYDPAGGDSVLGGKIKEHDAYPEDYMITIEGPKNKLKKIKGARVKPFKLDLSDFGDNYSVNGQLEFYDVNGEAVDSTYITVPDDGVVEIKGPIMRTKSFDLSVVFEDQTDADLYEVKWTPEKLEVMGERAVINDLTNNDFVFTVSGSAADYLTKGYSDERYVGSKTFVFDLPEGVEMTGVAKSQDSFDEVKVIVTVEKKPASKPVDNPVEK